jgi:hypothetical protein
LNSGTIIESQDICPDSIPQSAKRRRILDLIQLVFYYFSLPTYLPAPLIVLGIPCTIHYIWLPSSGTHVALTANVTIKITATTADAVVVPGQLDVLLVPGPDPNIEFAEETLEFVRRHFE